LRRILGRKAPTAGADHDNPGVQKSMVCVECLDDRSQELIQSGHPESGIGILRGLIPARTEVDTEKEPFMRRQFPEPLNHAFNGLFGAPSVLTFLRRCVRWFLASSVWERIGVLINFKTAIQPKGRIQPRAGQEGGSSVTPQ
jgi:hypothetical protein